MAPRYTFNIPSVWHTEEAAERTRHIRRLTRQDNERMRDTNGTDCSIETENLNEKKKTGKSQQATAVNGSNRVISTYTATTVAAEQSSV